MKNLFVCCDEKIREKMEKKIHLAFEDSVKVVTDPAQADLAYIIGEVTPEMENQVEKCKEIGLKTVHVNEDLVNTQMYNKVNRYITRELER